MNVKQAIDKRRAYRSLMRVEVTAGLIRDLAESAQLSPSCFNNQPWRFVFIFDPDVLVKMHSALSKGNQWAKSSSMMIAVFSRIDFDCRIKERNYYLFDTGMATAFIILRATELGLVAHPIAGYDEDMVKKILGIPRDMRVITLIMVGKFLEKISPILVDHQIETEKKRPERLPIEKFAFKNRFSAE